MLDRGLALPFHPPYKESFRQRGWRFNGVKLTAHAGARRPTRERGVALPCSVINFTEAL